MIREALTTLALLLLALAFAALRGGPKPTPSDPFPVPWPGGPRTSRHPNARTAPTPGRRRN